MIKKKDPTISAIMPVYNSEIYIEGTIKSILNQTYKDFEFIIIDDGSSDNTQKIIEKLAKKDKRIIFLQNKKNSGISYTRNKGIKKAKGEYIATIDADDWVYPERFEKQINFLKQNTKIGVLGSSFDVCDKNLNIQKTREYKHTDAELRKTIFKYSPFCHACTMFRKDGLEQAGGYNENLKVAVDYDIYFRVGRFYKFANLEESLVKVRFHGNSITQKKGKMQETNTLLIRLKAVIEHGYKMSFGDKVYFFIQLMSMYLIPFKFKLWIFNKIR